MPFLRASGLATAALLLSAGSCRDSDVGEGDQFAQVTVRVSVGPAGQEGNGQNRKSSISRDGRYVVFESLSDNLVDGDANTVSDVFLKDRRDGHVEWISERPGLPGPQSPEVSESLSPSISGGGDFVVLESRGNLDLQSALPMFPRPKNIFRRVRSDHSIRRVIGVGAMDNWPNADCGAPTVSADGRYVAFLSRATDIGFANPAGQDQVYLADMNVDPPALTLVSHADGTPAGVCDNTSFFPQITADGNFVVFTSFATDLRPAPDANVGADVFIWDRSANTNSLVSLNDGDVQANGSCQASAVSGDGRFVVFFTNASNVVGVGVAQQVVVRDRTLNSTFFASVDGAGNPVPPPGAGGGAISEDGRFVAFGSGAQELSPVPLNGTSHVFVRDLLAGRTELVSQSLLGAANQQAFFPAISGDGRWVGWTSAATNLVFPDANGEEDAFVRGPFR